MQRWMQKMLEVLTHNPAREDMHRELINREGQTFDKARQDFLASPNHRKAGAVYLAASDVMVVADEIAPFHPVQAMNVFLRLADNLHFNFEDARLEERRGFALRKALDLVPTVARMDPSEASAAIIWARGRVAPGSLLEARLNDTVRRIETTQPQFAGLQTA